MKKFLSLSCIIILLILMTGCGKKLSCEDGYILKEKSCYKEIENKVATEVYTCEDGYTLKEDNSKCEKTETVAAKKQYSCNNGYNLSGDKCLGVSTINATPTYSCPNGGTLSGSKCVQRVADTQALKSRYYCPYDHLTLEGKICYSEPIPSNVECQDSIKIGNRCAVNAIFEYYCVRGEQVSNSICMVTVSTQANVSYSCQSGYTLNGTKCSKNVSVNANTNYTCDNEYTLKDNTCQKIVESDRIVNYTCEDNYELKENKCILYDMKEAVKK